jgi:LacI family repressor for deo operon, udp, cdd, tsx, nupC, and nupG
MRAVRSFNLEIPGDIAVTGFDNYAFSQFLQPPLTTVNIPVYEMGRMASSMLIDKIEGIDPVKNLGVFPTEIIIRESS